MFLIRKDLFISVLSQHVLHQNLTCELINPGGGDGGSSTMVAWPVAWASWLVLVVAVGVLAASVVGAVVFFGGMVKDETVSSR